MAESSVPIKRAQKVVGHASSLRTLEIHTLVMNRRYHVGADQIVELAGFADAGNARGTMDAVEPEKQSVSS